MESMIIYNLRYEKVCELLDGTAYKAYGLNEDFSCTEISGLTFDIPLANPKSKYVINENLVCLNGEFYRIKNPQTVYDSDGKSYLHVTCSHTSDTLRDNTITMEETLPVNVETLIKRALQYRYTVEGSNLIQSKKSARDDCLKTYTEAMRKANRLKIVAELDNATEQEKTDYATAEANVVTTKAAYKSSMTDLANATMEADKTSTPTLGWEVGNITVDKTILRGLESVEDSIFNVLLNIAEKYDGLLRFNSSTKKVDLLKMETSGSAVLDLKLSNNLKGVTIDYDTSEMVTKMYCFGNQTDEGVDLTIMGVNPTGRAYIENYDYFKGLGYTDADIEKNPELFVKTSVWRDTNYYIASDLYNDGVEKLKKSSMPVINVSVSALDFTNVFGMDNYINLKVGDPVNIIDEDTGLSFVCFVIKRTINFDEKFIYNLELTNKIVYNTTLSKLFKRSAKTENSISENGSIPSFKIDDLAGLFVSSDMLPFYVAVEEYPHIMKEGMLYLKYEN